MRWNQHLATYKPGQIPTVEQSLDDHCREILDSEGWTLDDCITVHEDGKLHYFTPDTSEEYLHSIFCERGYLVKDSTRRYSAYGENLPFDLDDMVELKSGILVDKEGIASEFLP